VDRDWNWLLFFGIPNTPHFAAITALQALLIPPIDITVDKDITTTSGTGL